MLLCLVAVNDAPAVVWPAGDLSVAFAALSVAVHHATLDEAVTRLAVELVEDDGDDWRSYRAPDGRDVTAMLSDLLRDEDRALWLLYRQKVGAVVQREGRD